MMARQVSRLQWLHLLLCSTCLSACTLAPKLHDETPTLAPAFAGQSNWVSAKPLDDTLRGEWWLQFHDAGLTRLEAEFSSGNLSYQAAVASLEAARLGVKAARSLLLPSITANVGATRSRTSVNAPSYSTTRGPFDNDFSANAAMSYELDLFGRVRSAYQGLEAQTAAQAGDVKSLELILRAQLAITYFAVHALDGEIASLNQWADIERKAARQAKILWSAGAMARSDYDAQVQALAVLETTLADATQRREQLQHALALLVGADPSVFIEPASPLSLQHALVVDATVVPSELLQRRPDIAAALRRVQAANTAIGSARAAYWPVFNVAGLIGRESQQQNSWWQGPSALWAGVAQSSVLLLDGGRRKATIDASRASFNSTVMLYRQTVLNAVAEVEDVLASRQALSVERPQSLAALSAAQSSFRIAQSKLTIGTITQIELSREAQALYDATVRADESEVLVLSAEINLIRGLGGGMMLDSATR